MIAPFPSPVKDELSLKTSVVEMAQAAGRMKDTGAIAGLGFGQDCSIPLNLRFNNVPHPEWVRNYLYESVTQAILKAIDDDTIPNKSRMQLKVNFPEVNQIQ